MKHHGAMMEYTEERMQDLMRAYDEYISSCAYIRMPDVYAAIINMESMRFWVSEIRATKVIYAMLRGVPLKGMRPLKREMFEEILKRVLDLKKRRPELTVKECCCIVVAQPAPKFYLAPGSAKIMICKARKKWVQEKLKRLRLL
ncbi:hypothetical protein QUW11_01325 [Mediterranea massiliensis]|nr:hypothetical protein [Mediterranea sp. ET5]MDM8122736.1 hypothetical protein [Mediterranea massiliensis]MDM8197192.1 hypothetical protein [Mediterranea massiliensis]